MLEKMLEFEMKSNLLTIYINLVTIILREHNLVTVSRNLVKITIGKILSSENFLISIKNCYKLS